MRARSRGDAMGERVVSGVLSTAVSVLLFAVALLAQRGLVQERPKPQTTTLTAPPNVANESTRRADHLPIRLPPPPPVAKPSRTKPTPAPARRRVAARPPQPAPHKAPPRQVVEPLTAAAENTRPEPQTPAAPIQANPKLRQAGRTMLRLLEHGEGPAIRIAWPASPRKRDRLYRRLERCYGMRTAVVDADMSLYFATGPAGAPWKIDLDRFSGFIRDPAGRPIPEETARAARIAARHGLSGWRPARVFGRDVDAVLLGGLYRLAGKAYDSARSITAAYGMRGGRLLLQAIHIDGNPVAGAVDLTGAALRGCGAGVMG